MDPLDAFYQHLDSEHLLKEHGDSLVAEARSILARDSRIRLAGLIAAPDSVDAAAIRQLIAMHSGRTPPPGLMVGLVPRQAVEPLLTDSMGTEPWLEQGWRRQHVLPVIVSTRDGHRFGFFGLGAMGSSQM
jgi:hypothetical protein